MYLSALCACAPANLSARPARADAPPRTAFSRRGEIRDNSRIDAQSGARSISVVDAQYAAASASGDPARPLTPLARGGRTLTRRLTVFNDRSAGTRLVVRLEPALARQGQPAISLPGLSQSFAVPRAGSAAATFRIDVPPVTQTMRLSLTITVIKSGRVRFSHSEAFVVTPRDMPGTTAVVVGRDDHTGGDWPGVYGKEAFLIPVFPGYSAFELPSILIRRGAGTAKADRQAADVFDPQWNFENAAVILARTRTVADRRVPYDGPGKKAREPVAFAAHGAPLVFRVTMTDGLPHDLSVYLLDYKRSGAKVVVEAFDAQNDRLALQRVSGFQEGAYIRMRVTGEVILSITSLTAEPATASGLFVDPVK